MSWCLTKQSESDVRKALRLDGDPQKMVDRGTEGRLAWFEKYVGKENATELNYLFETKMLLKNQQKGFESFVKNMGGSKEIKTEFSDKVARLEKALSNTEVDQFLETFVSRRLGVGVSQGDYENITKLSDKLNTLRQDYDPVKSEWKSEKSADQFGSTQVVLNHFVKSLKNPEQSIISILKDRGYRFKQESKTGIVKATGNVLSDTASQVADNSIALVASVDGSYIGRQGIFTLLTGHPVIWGKTALSSIKDFVTTLGNGKAEDALMAKIFSDPLYMNGEYQKAGIIDRLEDQFPTTLPGRVPILGKFFKASDVSFKNSAVRMRTELYKTLRAVNVSRGVEMTSEQIKGLGKVINSVNARGDIGRFNSSFLRLLMWSPKMLKADLDILTAHQFSDIPKEQKRIALDNLVKIIIATVIIEGLVTANDDESTEFNPLSSDFLKLKFGDTRISFLRGVPGLIVLTARMLSGKYKSSTTGETKDFGAGFGETSRFDSVLEFFVNKAPPSTRSLVDVLRGRNFKGEAPTASSILIQAGVPISFQNVIELNKNPSIDNAFGVVLDFFGFSSNTFKDSNTKTKIIPTGEVIKNDDFISMVQVYAEAMGTDPETAFNRIFTNQKIMQVSKGGIIVVERQDVADSEAFKKQWVKENGGKTSDMKEVKLDHTVPNKLGGEEKPSNWKIVSTSVWSSYTKTENLLIKAVKDEKISLKDAQKLIVEFKSIDDTKKRAEFGEKIKNDIK
jgi:hypothetical protein